MRQRKRTTKRRGVKVSGRPLNVLEVMLISFTDKTSPLWHDMRFYVNVIESLHTQDEIKFVKTKLNINREVRDAVKRYANRSN